MGWARDDEIPHRDLSRHLQTISRAKNSESNGLIDGRSAELLVGLVDSDLHYLKSNPRTGHESEDGSEFGVGTGGRYEMARSAGDGVELEKLRMVLGPRGQTMQAAEGRTLPSGVDVGRNPPASQRQDPALK